MPLHNRGFLSIVGLYNWDDSLFNDMVVPTGINKDEIVKEILFLCGDLEVLYPDWDVMKTAIKAWSDDEIFRWNKIQKIAEMEYNPIENYDRMENEVVTSNRNRKGTTAGSTANNNTDTHSVTGYNTSTPVTDTEDTTSGTTTNAQTSADSEDGSGVKTSRIHGNIGVTTPAQMITGELGIYDKLNLYKIIPEDFKMRFCLMVY